MMQKLIAALLLLCALSGAAWADDFGQAYDQFLDLYAQNILFINQNTGRHLLAQDFQADFNAQGERIYVLESGALTAEIQLDDLASQIAYCRITLTAPEGMTYGDSQYSDFAVSGYHSYALQMAMHPAEDAAQRYALVTEVEAGLAAGGGTYQTQVGDYRLSCTAGNGTAVLLFENDLLMGSAAETPTETETEPTVEIKENE